MATPKKKSVIPETNNSTKWGKLSPELEAEAKADIADVEKRSAAIAKKHRVAKGAASKAVKELLKIGEKDALEGTVEAIKVHSQEFYKVIAKHGRAQELPPHLAMIPVMFSAVLLGTGLHDINKASTMEREGLDAVLDICFHLVRGAREAGMLREHPDE